MSARRFTEGVPLSHPKGWWDTGTLTWANGTGQRDTSGTVSLKALVRQARERDSARDTARDTSDASKKSPYVSECPTGTLFADRKREAVRVFSRVLDAEIWLVADEDREAFAAEIVAEGDTRPIVTTSEAMILGRMLETDAREIFAIVARVAAIMPGARLVDVLPEKEFDA
jgi:hypothetical protein